MKLVKRIKNPVRTQKETEVFWDLSRIKHYAKIGTVEARKATVGEEIVTVINGATETTNVAKLNDVVVRGSAGEEYIISIEKFRDRYEGPSLANSYQTYNAIGKTYALQWNGEPFRLVASWGEEMQVETGDYLCSIEKEPTGDIYRVEKSVFEDTYLEE